MSYVRFFFFGRYLIWPLATVGWSNGLVLILLYLIYHTRLVDQGAIDKMDKRNIPMNIIRDFVKNFSIMHCLLFSTFHLSIRLRNYGGPGPTNFFHYRRIFIIANEEIKKKMIFRG